MYDDMFPAERAASLSQSVQRPYTQPGAPGASTGFGGAMADIVPNATLTTANAWSGILDAYGKAAVYRDVATDPAILLGKPAPDMDKLKAETIDQIGNNQLGVALREEAKKYTPDPLATGAAGQIVFGVGTSLAKAGAYSLTGPAAPVLFGADVGVNRADELKDQGVDATTANTAGLVSGVAGAVGMKLPAAMGATRLQSAAIGAVTNPALNVAEVGGIRAILQHADYDKIAQQYQPFDPLNLTVAAIVGAGFGAGFHTGRAKLPAGEAPAPTLTPDEHAAALTMHEAQTRDGDTLTQPGDIAAANAAKDGQDLARQQLDNGEPVNVAVDIPTDAATVASRAADVAQRMKDGDTLLGAKLDFAGRRVEDLEAEYARLADDKGRNVTDSAHLIDTDLVRELSPGYRDNRLRSSDIHEAASALTKEMYARALARPVGEGGRDPVVQFLAGGGGSGKSTAKDTLLGASNVDVRMDGTFSSLARARADVEAALASGRDVQIIYVFRSPEKAIQGAIQRAANEGRPVPVEALASAHEGAPQVVKTLANDYNGNDRVQVRAIWNDGDNPTQARFIPIGEIPHVDRNQATAVFRQAVDDALAGGRIEPAVWRAFLQGIHRPNADEGAGQLPQTRPEQHAQDPLTGNGGIGQGAPPDTPGTIVEKVVDAVSRLLGRDEPTQTPPEANLKAETPEQAIAFDLAARYPDALIPSGELDADGNPIQIIRAADLVQQAADVEKQAQKETAAFGAAVNCALRFPRA
ncbi:MAG: zeta toxin family protein [Burkholderia sp.]